MNTFKFIEEVAKQLNPPAWRQHFLLLCHQAEIEPAFARGYLGVVMPPINTIINTSTCTCWLCV